MKDVEHDPVPIIPYGRQSISDSDIDAVVEVLRSDWITQGPMVARFEATVEKYVGCEHGIATSSATSALHIACLSLDVGEGDWVWTSPNTFVASANCALYCGAKVDFVDIDPCTCNLSVERLAEKLAQAKLLNKLPKVVIPVHFAGQSCDMVGIHALASEYGFRIIEDASHGIGGQYNGGPVGCCHYSDITIFSFHPVKIITTGEGGMALTNDSHLAKLMRQYRSHGITNAVDEMEERVPNEIWNYQQIRLGYNYRMTDIQAALGLSQMSRLDEFVTIRHQIAARYDQALLKLPVSVPRQLASTYSSYHLYVIRVDRDKCGKSQCQVYHAMHRAGVLVNIHYIPVYRQPYFERMGFPAGYCPESERYHRETMSLPMYPTLTLGQQETVINALKGVLEL